MSMFGESILRACANLASRWPWLVLAVALVITALAGYQSTKLTVDTSTEEILSSELPFRQVEIDFERTFPEEDLAVAVLDAPTPDEADAAARDLLARLAAREQSFDWVELAGASPYFDRYGLLFLQPDEIAGIAEEVRAARRLLTALGNDPTLRGLAQFLGLVKTGVEEAAAPAETSRILTRLADVIAERAGGTAAEVQWSEMFGTGAREGTRRILQMKPVLDNSSIDRAGPALAELDSAIAGVREAFPEVTVRVTGEPVLRQQELNDAFSGAVYASSLSFVLVALSLIVGIRSGRLIAALLITLVIGSIWTTGLAAVTVGRLNLISVAFLVLFFGLGVDFGTHLGLRHLEEAKRGKPFTDALRAAMLGEGPSITLSAICAALAFLAFVPTSYTGLAEFGIISALGMLVAVIVTFTVQPALMALMPPRPKPGMGITIGIESWIERRHTIVLVLAGIATAVAIYFSLGVQIDTNPLNLQNQNTEAVRTYRDLARDPETSPYALDAVVANLEAAGELAPKLAALPGVSGVRWIQDFIPPEQEARIAAIRAGKERIGEAFFAPGDLRSVPTDDELTQAFAAIKADAEAIANTPADIPVDATIIAAGKELAAALARFEASQGTTPAVLAELGSALTRQMADVLADLRAKFSVEQPVTVADIPAELRDDWIAADGRVRIHVLPSGDIGTPQAMKSFTETVQAVAPEVAGAPASVTGAGQAILEAFAEAILYTVFSIGLVVAVLRRRISDVLLVLAPLGVASLWTVAASAGLDLPFNFANIIVIPLLIGLGVASSIHIVVRTHEVVTDSAGTHEEGMHVLDTSTPLAVLVAQLNTVAAFATLAIAEHRGLFSMGVLLGVAILFVLIVSLIVLPSFMIAIGVGAKPAAPRPEGPASP